MENNTNAQGNNGKKVLDYIKKNCVKIGAYVAGVAVTALVSYKFGVNAGIKIGQAAAKAVADIPAEAVADVVENVAENI